MRYDLSLSTDAFFNTYGRKKSFAHHTLGCKVNAYESEAIAGMFSSDGFDIVPFSDDADVYLINSCTVTNISDRKSRQIIRRTRRNHPDSIIVVCGCYSQSDPETVLDIGADIVLGTQDRNSVVSAVKSYSQKTNCVHTISSDAEFEELSSTPVTERTRAYLKIQDGCNNFCSYCIIPYTRGRVRSRSLESIRSEAKRLVCAGFCEIVLTGIEVYSYGRDTGHTLLDAIACVDSIDGVDRIRLSSVDPRAFTDDFIEALTHFKKLCPHFHICAQSGCDQTLTRMNRHYTTDEFLSRLTRLREAIDSVAITTDIITGFPGETEEEFEITKQFVKSAGFSDIHVFPYSQRRGTVADKMEQVPLSVRQDRARELIALGKTLTEDFLDTLIGTTQSVLFEREVSQGVYEGFSKNYVRVRAQSDTLLDGCTCDVMITERKKDVLTGKIIG